MKGEKDKMDFHETRMGRQIYSSDLPRMVRALEKIGETLGKSTPANAGENSIFRLVESPEEGFLKEAENYCEIHGGETHLANLIAIRTIKTGRSRDAYPYRLVFIYAHAAPEERRAIDGFFSVLTGMTFADILRRYIIENETENAWRAKEGYIIIQASDEGGWDYTLYTPAYELIDGGQVEEPAITAGELKDQLVKDFGWDTASITPADYDEVEAAVTAVEEKKWME